MVYRPIRAAVQREGVQPKLISRPAHIRILYVVIIVAFLLLKTVVAFAAMEAYLKVDHGKTGQALLFNRAGICFALTPNHVLGIGQYATLKLASSDGDIYSGQADLCARFKDLDLALLKVSGLPIRSCGDLFVAAIPTDRHLVAGDLVVLRYINPQGSAERRAVFLSYEPVADPNHFWVRSQTINDELAPGYSGSVLYSGETPIGQLLSISVAEDTPAGAGKVLRLDTAYRAVAGLFQNASLAELVDSTCLATRSGIKVQADDAKGNVAAASCGAQVVSWTSPPLSADHRPDILVAPPEQGGHWVTVMDSSTTLIIKLCGEAATTISRITLSSGSGANIYQLPEDIKLFIRAAEAGPWTELFPREKVRTKNNTSWMFAPKRAIQLRLEIRADKGKEVGLARISVF